MNELEKASRRIAAKQTEAEFQYRISLEHIKKDNLAEARKRQQVSAYWYRLAREDLIPTLGRRGMS